MKEQNYVMTVKEIIRAGLAAKDPAAWQAAMQVLYEITWQWNWID